MQRPSKSVGALTSELVLGMHAPQRGETRARAFFDSEAMALRPGKHDWGLQVQRHARGGSSTMQACAACLEPRSSPPLDMLLSRAVLWAAQRCEQAPSCATLTR